MIHEWNADQNTPTPTCGSQDSSSASFPSLQLFFGIFQIAHSESTQMIGNVELHSEGRKKRRKKSNFLHATKCSNLKPNYLKFTKMKGPSFEPRWHLKAQSAELK